MIKLKSLLFESDSQYDIFCDMDGVLTDFDKAYYELTGERANVVKDKLSPQEFWFPIKNAGREWWSNMDWMPDGKKLWSYIKKYDPTLLSAPSIEKSSKVGKRNWVNNNLSGTKLIMTRSANKKKYASPTSILIDDTKRNIDDWISSGGIGIHHTSTSNTINQLKKLGL